MKKYNKKRSGLRSVIDTLLVLSKLSQTTRRPLSRYSRSKQGSTGASSGSGGGHFHDRRMEYITKS